MSWRGASHKDIHPHSSSVLGLLAPTARVTTRNTQTRPPYIKAPGGRKRLSLIQMILLRHLKAGFGKQGGLTAVVILIVTAQVQ